MSALGQKSALGMESTCTESAVGACVHARARAHTHTDTDTDTNVTSPPRADANFLTHFIAKGGPSIFEWSTFSM